MIPMSFFTTLKASLDKPVTGGIYKVSRNPMYTERYCAETYGEPYLKYKEAHPGISFSSDNQILKIWQRN